MLTKRLLGAAVLTSTLALAPAALAAPGDDRGDRDEGSRDGRGGGSRGGGDSHRGGGGGSHGREGGGAAHAVPEFDPTALGAVGAAIVAGGGIIAARRRRR